MRIITRMALGAAVVPAFLIVAAAVLLPLVLYPTEVLPHEATNIAGQPTGWNYPWACCSNMDCKMVDGARVHETPAGYIVDGAWDDAPIGYTDKRVKDSPDGEYHWCAHQAGNDKGKTICLFVPPKGF